MDLVKLKYTTMMAIISPLPNLFFAVDAYSYFFSFPFKTVPLSAAE